MGLDYKDKTRDSVKDSNAVSDKESDFKSKDNDMDNKMTQGTSEEKKESKWDNIDWSKTNSEEKKETKWDNIDWSKDASEEKKESKWDNIDWSKDTIERKKDTKWDNIDWSKDTIERKKETKWDNIDWSKTNSEEKKETKWDNIDWSKDASKEKKIEEYKNDKKEDNSMFGNKYDENFDELKDFKNNLEDKEANEDYLEGIEDKLEHHDFDKSFVEDIEDQLEHSDIDKDFVEGIEDKLGDNDLDKDFIEGIEDELEPITQDLQEEQIKHAINERDFSKDEKIEKYVNDNRNSPEKELFETLRKIYADKLKKEPEKLSDNELGNQINFYVYDALKNKRQVRLKSIEKIENAIENDKDLSEENKIIAHNAIKEFKEIRDYINENVNKNSGERELIDKLRNIYANELKKPVNKITDEKLGRLIGCNHINDILRQNLQLQKKSIAKIEVTISNDLNLSKENRELAVYAVNNFKKTRDLENLNSEAYIQKKRDIDLSQDLNKNIAEQVLIETLRRTIANKLNIKPKDLPDTNLGKELNYPSLRVALVNKSEISFKTIKNIEKIILEEKKINKQDKIKVMSALDKYKQIRGFKDNDLKRDTYERKLIETIRDIYAKNIGINPQELSNYELERQLNYTGVRGVINKNNIIRPRSLDIIEKRIKVDKNLSQKDREKILDTINNYREIKSYKSFDNPEAKLIESLREVYANKLGIQVEKLSIKELGRLINYKGITNINKESSIIIPRTLNKIKNAIKNDNELSIEDKKLALNTLTKYKLEKYPFDYEINGRTLLREEKINKLAEHLKEAVSDSEFRQEYNLSENESPPYHVLDNEFTKAYKYTDIKYSDIVKASGLTPNEGLVSLEVGDNLHWKSELIFLEHTRNNNCHSYYEPYTNIETKKSDVNDFYKKYGRRHSDNSIIIDNNFKNLSSEAMKFYEKFNGNIHMIIVDYHIGNSEKSAEEHCLRGYQGKGKLLINVPIHATRPRPPPLNIPYRNNVRIIDPLSFSKFMGYDENTTREMLNLCELAKRSMHDPKSREKLDRIGTISKKEILKKYNHSHDKLKSYVKNPNNNLPSDLLKYIPDKTSLEYYFAKQTKEQKLIDDFKND